MQLVFIHNTMIDDTIRRYSGARPRARIQTVYWIPSVLRLDYTIIKQSYINIDIHHTDHWK